MIRDPEQILAGGLAWREGCRRPRRESLTEPLDWNENQEAPYFTDKPTWDCYADLMLWAAYDEQPGAIPAPATMWRNGPRIEHTKPALQMVLVRGTRIASPVELWLPNLFGFVFKTEDVGGNPCWAGLSVALFWQLEDLNPWMWQAVRPVELAGL